jgi:hypothetical protein
MNNEIVEDFGEETIEESVDESIEETPEEETETPTSEDETDDETNSDVVEEENDSEPQPEEEEDKPEIPYGETPKEWALRKEIENLRQRIRKDRNEELFVPNEIPSINNETTGKNKELLEKYDEDQLNELGEIIKAKAEEMGFVKKEELRAETYKETADSLLNNFLENHKEYLPENDKDNTLWNRFREEFQMYKQPQNPKDFKKIYERIHSSIFNINSGNLNKINAQKEKLNVVSHTSKTGNRVPNNSNRNNIDLSGLKGFSQEELDELVS